MKNKTLNNIDNDDEVKANRSILEAIGSGMILSVPKERETGFGSPALFDGVFKFIDPGYRDRISISWETYDRFMKSKEALMKLILIDENDQFDYDGKIVRRGWKSKGLVGLSYDYYRMIQ